MKNMSNVYFSKYKVSTITCNANIGIDISIDLSILYDNINPIDEDDNIIWIQNLKDNCEYVKGFYPKKIRKSKKNNKKKNRFDNQITIIYKFNKDYKPNIKIFKNGNIQLTGIKNVEDTDIIANKIIEYVKKSYKINKDIDLSEDKIDFLKKLQFSNFKIRMINSDFKTYTNPELTDKFNIRRKELHNLLISSKYNNKCSFQPGIYQGVKLEYYYNNNNNNGICVCENHVFNKKFNNICKKVTIAIFESGSILITGGITFEQIDIAYKYITKIIKDNTESLKRPNINIFENL
jgi:TATA-box binding protein (TBP) (component of TFIID and TFIIIB)|tara:strand:+ start:3900 stop:4775 length:876 start_codon:yes stop_codon:yes gene_type:complete